MCHCKARDGRLTIEDMAGGTFTISNVSLPYLGFFIIR